MATMRLSPAVTALERVDDPNLDECILIETVLSMFHGVDLPFDTIDIAHNQLVIRKGWQRVRSEILKLLPVILQEISPDNASDGSDDGQELPTEHTLSSTRNRLSILLKLAPQCSGTEKQASNPTSIPV